jgi:hypothetical protein
MAFTAAQVHSQGARVKLIRCPIGSAVDLGEAGHLVQLAVR